MVSVSIGRLDRIQSASHIDCASRVVVAVYGDHVCLGVFGCLRSSPRGVLVCQRSRARRHRSSHARGPGQLPAPRPPRPVGRPRSGVTALVSADLIVVRVEHDPDHKLRGRPRDQWCRQRSPVKVKSERGISTTCHWLAGIAPFGLSLVGVEVDRVRLVYHWVAPLVDHGRIMVLVSDRNFSWASPSVRQTDIFRVSVHSYRACW